MPWGDEDGGMLKAIYQANGVYPVPLDPARYWWLWCSIIGTGTGSSRRVEGNRGGTFALSLKKVQFLTGAALFAARSAPSMTADSRAASIVQVM